MEVCTRRKTLSRVGESNINLRVGETSSRGGRTLCCSAATGGRGNAANRESCTLRGVILSCINSSTNTLSGSSRAGRVRRVVISIFSLSETTFFKYFAAVNSLKGTAPMTSGHGDVWAYLPEWRFEGANFASICKVVTHLILFSIEVTPEGWLGGLDRCFSLTHFAQMSQPHSPHTCQRTFLWSRQVAS